MRTDAAVVPDRAGVREWLGLALLVLPTILLGLDVTVLYLVLPSLAADLEPSATQTLWIMDVYGFFIAGFLVTMGTLGDRIGRRRLLTIGALAFAAASVFAAFAPSAEALILARALLGVAGATLMPSTLSLVSVLFRDPRQRAMAIGIWATMFAVGMAAGPIVGGVLVDLLWWGAAFLIAVPIAVAVLIGAPRLLPEQADPTAGRLDLISVGLSLATILPVIYAIKQTAAYGFSWGLIAAASLGIVAGIVFVRRQQALADPLLDMSLFRTRAFSAALAVLLIGLVGVGGTMYLVTQYLQDVQDYSPIVAGLWMGPPALAMVIAAVGSPIIARWLRPGVIMAATLGISVLGYILLATAAEGRTLTVVSGFALVYLGLGAIAALGTDMVVTAAPSRKTGSAAAMSEAAQDLGLAVGVAILGSVSAAVYRSSPTTTFTDGMNTASWFAAVAVVVALALCLTVLRHLPPLVADTGEPPGVVDYADGDQEDYDEHARREPCRRPEGSGAEAASPDY